MESDINNMAEYGVLCITHSNKNLAMNHGKH